MSCISEQPDQGRGSIIGRIKGYMELRSFDGLQRSIHTMKEAPSWMDHLRGNKDLHEATQGDSME